MATWSATVLAPVVAALERSQAIVRDQAETIGELRATVATLEARTAAQTVQPPTERVGALRAFLMRWWPLAAMLIVAIALAAALLLVPG